jgi:hypothetical protein
VKRPQPSYPRRATTQNVCKHENTSRSRPALHPDEIKLDDREPTASVDSEVADHRRHTIKLRQAFKPRSDVDLVTNR